MSRQHWICWVLSPPLRQLRAQPAQARLGLRDILRTSGEDLGQSPQPGPQLRGPLQLLRCGRLSRAVRPLSAQAAAEEEECAPRDLQSPPARGLQHLHDPVQPSKHQLLCVQHGPCQAQGLVAGTQHALGGIVVCLQVHFGDELGDVQGR